MIRHVETSKTSKKKDRLLNVKGKEMGISGEYRLEYMPLMIQKKQTGGISYSNDRMGTFIIIIFFLLWMFCTCTCILQCP